MKRDYEESISKICYIHNWRRPYGIPIDEIGTAAREQGRQLVDVAEERGHDPELFLQAMAERQGAVGVACVLAYLNGVKASVGDIAKHLSVSPAEVEKPFRRLLINGVFSSKREIAEDSSIVGGVEGTVEAHFYRSKEDKMKLAWGTIAGLAAGFSGLRESEAA